MRGEVTVAVLAVALLGAGALAAADESAIRLHEGPGRDLAAGRCAICHSLDYIVNNAPILDRGGWQKEIQKMRERYGAPISDQEAQQILDYLAAGYAGKP